MSKHGSPLRNLTRRDLLRAGLCGIGVGAAATMRVPALFGRAARAIASQAREDGRILVVLELSGGNDGLNTVIPSGDDAYYRLRPTIGIPAAETRQIDDHFGFGKQTGSQSPLGVVDFRLKKQRPS